MFMPTNKHSHTPSHDVKPCLLFFSQAALLEIEDEEDEDEGTEHLVEELLANSGDLADEALVEKLLENFDLEEEEDVVSFFDSFHFSSMNIVCFCWEFWTQIQMN
ncbi:hypothetical protein F2Q70_00028065, partial [Brassica cretica]